MPAKHEQQYVAWQALSPADRSFAVKHQKLGTQHEAACQKNRQQSQRIHSAACQMDIKRMLGMFKISQHISITITLNR